VDGDKESPDYLIVQSRELGFGQFPEEAARKIRFVLNSTNVPITERAEATPESFPVITNPLR
jgi:hypothetical protein